MDAGYFRQLSTLDNSFRLIRLILLGTIIGVLALGGWVVYWANQNVEAARQRVYVMENGQSIMLALAQEHNINRPAEARHHVRTFLKLLFELEPDETQIEKSVGQATYLGDRQSVLRQYLDFKEKGYYQQLVQGDVRQKLTMELGTIQVDAKNTPYKFRAKGVLSLIRATSITTRNLDVEGYLVESQRTDNNPHGFIVERFKVIDNSDIQTVDRDPNQAASF